MSAIKQNKNKVFSLGLASALLVLSTPSHGEPLRLLNWDDYLSAHVVEQWQQRGHTLETVLFDNDSKRDEILLKSKAQSIDLAVVDETVAALFGEQGRLLALTTDNLPSLANIEPFWRERCGKYAAPYFWGTLGLAYRTDKLAKAPDSWLDILEPAPELRGHIGMMNDYTDMLAPGLFSAGFSLNTESQSELKTVFTQLQRQAPHVLTYTYPISFLTNNPRAEDLHMAVVYGGDQSSMNQIAGAPGRWRYVVPKEGTVLWVDCMAIPASSERKGQALAFLNFINSPEIAARNAQDIEIATPNVKARAHLSDALKSNTEIYPAKAVIERSELYSPLSRENIKLRLRITNAVVNTHESSKTH